MGLPRLRLAKTLFIPYRRHCRHFAYAADAPLLSLSRHFPRFSGGIYPEGGSKRTLRWDISLMLDIAYLVCGDCYANACKKNACVEICAGRQCRPAHILSINTPSFFVFFVRRRISVTTISKERGRRRRRAPDWCYLCRLLHVCQERRWRIPDCRRRQWANECTR